MYYTNYKKIVIIPNNYQFPQIKIILLITYYLYRYILLYNNLKIFIIIYNKNTKTSLVLHPIIYSHSKSVTLNNNHITDTLTQMFNKITGYVAILYILHLYMIYLATASMQKYHILLSMQDLVDYLQYYGR